MDLALNAGTYHDLCHTPEPSAQGGLRLAPGSLAIFADGEHYYVHDSQGPLCTPIQSYSLDKLSRIEAWQPGAPRSVREGLQLEELDRVLRPWAYQQETKELNLSIDDLSL